MHTLIDLREAITAFVLLMQVRSTMQRRWARFLLKLVLSN